MDQNILNKIHFNPGLDHAVNQDPANKEKEKIRIFNHKKNLKHKVFHIEWHHEMCNHMEKLNSNIMIMNKRTAIYNIFWQCSTS